MILPDVNLLVYAYNADAPGHRRAKAWWETCLSESRSVGLPWAVLLGYLRLMTSPSVLEDPLPPVEAIGHLRSWLERPQAQILQPGPRHLEVLETLMSHRASSQITTDVHLASLAIEHRAELFSNDSGFSHFPGLLWTNPLH
ncbi:MAG TPA: TA system VapC family ribonuclease toxin [Thermoanaerobaculia bacterium]|nr:TA system VapC family ribonuclease toxin [Thermoanaerobaculia bacterium]